MSAVVSPQENEELEFTGNPCRCPKCKDLADRAHRIADSALVSVCKVCGILPIDGVAQITPHRASRFEMFGATENDDTDLQTPPVRQARAGTKHAARRKPKKSALPPTAGTAKPTRRKPAKPRPLKVRMAEASSRIDRLQRQYDAAKAEYERLQVQHRQAEQAKLIPSIKRKFKQGERLTTREMDILRKAL